jgi:hypothetical protein
MSSAQGSETRNATELAPYQSPGVGCPLQATGTQGDDHALMSTFFPLLVLTGRAHILPLLGRRRSYVSVVDGVRTCQTQSEKSVGDRVDQNENVNACRKYRIFISI